jgi:hypothetical protein
MHRKYDKTFEEMIIDIELGVYQKLIRRPDSHNVYLSATHGK